MGRKIPAKKHRGVKDPLQQQARRMQSEQKRINAPPRDVDEQPAPRSVARLFAAKPRHTRPDHPRVRNARKGGSSDGGGRLGGLSRAAGEGARAFSRRIAGAVKALAHPDQLRYPNEEDEQEEEQSRKKRRRRAGEGAEEGVGRESRARRRRLRLKQQRLAKQAESASQTSEVQYERVPFGAVVSAPPQLPAPRKANKDTAAPRPGKRELLLTSLLRPQTNAVPAVLAVKPVPTAAAARAELRRLDAVNAYRAVKRQKRIEANDSKVKQR